MLQIWDILQGLHVKMGPCGGRNRESESEKAEVRDGSNGHTTARKTWLDLSGFYSVLLIIFCELAVHMPQRAHGGHMTSCGSLLSSPTYVGSSGELRSPSLAAGISTCR